MRVEMTWSKVAVNYYTCHNYTPHIFHLQRKHIFPHNCQKEYQFSVLIDHYGVKFSLNSSYQLEGLIWTCWCDHFLIYKAYINISQRLQILSFLNVL